jgi:transcription-repair coupling factor (superfamily II helicase)
MAIKIKMKKILITRLDQGKDMLVFSFHEKTDIGPQKILDLVKMSKNNIRFSPDARLLAPLSSQVSHSPQAILHTANEIVDYLQPEASY